VVGEHLKKADHYLSENNFDAADREVKRAIEEEPRNIYALAYKEKIRESRRRFEEKQKHEEEERHQQEVALHEAKSQLAEIAKQQVQRVDVGEVHQRKSASVVEIRQYRDKLYEAWRDGVLTPLEVVQLGKLRLELNITDEEHHQLENEVKHESYVEALQHALVEGRISAQKSEVLADLRKQFGISVEEHLALESRILSELHARTESATIFVIDDEPAIVKLLQEILSDANFKVLSTTSPKEALQQLDAVVPDLILCDLKFPGTELSGFSIFDRVRKIPELTAVPFILLTGSKDEQTMRMGLQLGVDDYLTKPFSKETLLAVVKGKLKRFKALRKSM